MYLQSDAGSGSDQSDSSLTPLNKSSTPSQTTPAIEVTQENASDSLPGKSLSRKGSKTDKSKKEKSSRGSPDKSVKSKSPDKPQAVVEPTGKPVGGEGSVEKKQSATAEQAPADSHGKQGPSCPISRHVYLLHVRAASRELKTGSCKDSLRVAAMASQNSSFRGALAFTVI